MAEPMDVSDTQPMYNLGGSGMADGNDDADADENAQPMYNLAGLNEMVLSANDFMAEPMDVSDTQPMYNLGGSGMADGNDDADADENAQPMYNLAGSNEMV